MWVVFERGYKAPHFCFSLLFLCGSCFRNLCQKSMLSWNGFDWGDLWSSRVYWKGFPVPALCVLPQASLSSMLITMALSPQSLGSAFAEVLSTLGRMPERAPTLLAPCFLHLWGGIWLPLPPRLVVSPVVWFLRILIRLFLCKNASHPPGSLQSPRDISPGSLMSQ